MKDYLFSIFIILITIIIFFSCTSGGAELSLVGKWNVDSFVMILPGANQTFDTDGYIILRYDDTYEMDLNLRNVPNGAIEDDGVITSDYTAKTITFYSNDNDNQTYTYSLSGSLLTLVSNDYKFKCTRISCNY